MLIVDEDVVKALEWAKEASSAHMQRQPDGTWVVKLTFVNCRVGRFIAMGSNAIEVFGRAATPDAALVNAYSQTEGLLN